MACLDESALAIILAAMPFLFVYVGQTLTGLMSYLKPLFLFLALISLLFMVHGVLIMLNESGVYAPLLSLLSTFEIILIPMTIIIFVVHVLSLWIEMGDQIIKIMRKWGLR